MALLHESHLRITITKYRVKKHILLSGMLNDIEEKILNFKTREKYKISNKKNKSIPNNIPNLTF